MGRNSSGPGTTMPALFTRPASPRLPTTAATVRAAPAMEPASVTSIATAVRSGEAWR